MREPFMRLDPSKLGHSAAPTLIVLFIGSIVATIIGTFFFVSGTIMFGLSGLALGPAILGLLPVILAQA
ncbi:MAG: hypothetical protein OIF54_00935, partial [Cohaesibacter sp.]|nr:hypothetical protein [Cohaesibacter sp.]